MSYFKTNSAGNLTWCEAVNPHHLPGELSRCPACGPKSRLPEGKAMRDELNFRRELAALINRYSRENNSDTPDYILAKFAALALHAFEQAMIARDDWKALSGGEK